MPPRRKIVLPDHVREAVLSEIGLSAKVSADAEASFKLRVYLATQQGLTQDEIAQELSVSQAVISKWRNQGEQEARERGLVPNPGRPGEQ